MPVLSGSVTFARFRAERTKKKSTKQPERSLANALRAAAFSRLDTSGDQERSAGWVQVEDPDAVELAPSSFLFGDHLLVTWRIDAVRVPASALKRELAEWSRRYEEKAGHPPYRADKAAEKEVILKRLRKRAFVATRTHDVCWNQKSDEVQIWAGSRKAIEEVQIALEETFGLALHATSPGARVDAAGLDPAKLRPTAALFGDDVVREVSGGA